MTKQTLTKDEYVYLCKKHQKYVDYDMVSDLSFENAESIIKDIPTWDATMVKDEYGGYLG